MPDVRLRALVVPHTHWDRAWYWPAARLQVRLVECLTTVLRLCREHPEYRFTCDGQALMVEDYLQVRPDDRAEIAALVRAGRIRVGPLYCQPDVYCTGGEALIRNLLIGTAIARGLGQAQTALYLPDTFGLTPSLPMVAQGFGLTAILFMRGLIGEVPGMTSMSGVATALRRQVPEGTRLFRWTCPDGSEMRAFLLRDGYANAGGLGRAPEDGGVEIRYSPAHAVAALIAAAERQADPVGAPAGVAEPLLLLAGVDHQIPQVGLPEALRTASATSRFEFVFSDLDAVAARMHEHDTASWPHYQGEFHGSGAASVLGGTMSARIELKQRNAALERLLVHQLEPAAALVRWAGIDEPCADALGVAWRWLLQNHPHDDICGCSVDAVHRDDAFRFDQVEAGADGLRRRLVRRLVERFGGSPDGDERFAFLAFHAQGTPRVGPWRITLDFEARHRWGDYRLPAHYRVVDEAGAPVPFRELARGRSVQHPHETATLELHAPLPPATLRRFFLEPRPAPPPAKATRRLENRHLRVEVARDGSFSLTHLASGRRWSGLGLFGEQADIGDTYDFCDILGEREHLHAREPATLAPCGPGEGVQALRIVRTLQVPACAVEGRRSRERVALPTAIELVLGPEAEQLEVALSFTNTAADMRLRWCLPLGRMPAASRAGLKFNEVVRPCLGQPTGTTAPRIHPEHPADHFVAIDDEQGGLALLSEFPINYEVMSEPAPYLAVCVLRAVGFLTRVTLTTRQGGAGPDTPTPDAQCLGRSYTMRFALRAYAPAEAGSLFARAAAWRAEPLAAQIEGWWLPERPHPPEPASCWIRGDRPEVILSALKPAAEGTGIILRCFNAAATPVTTELEVADERPLQPVSLAEVPTGAWSCEAVAPRRWRLTLPPFALRTLRLG